MTADSEARGQARDRERTRLVFAKSDMKQAAGAAQCLLEIAHELRGVERVMWTGIVVTYARPFSKSNKVGPVKGRIVRLGDRMQRSLHERLCELRDQLFAHNDVTELRGAIETTELVEGARPGYVEWYQQMNPGALRDIADLATEFERRFAERLQEIEDEERRG